MKDKGSGASAKKPEHSIRPGWISSPGSELQRPVHRRQLNMTVPDFAGGSSLGQGSWQGFHSLSLENDESDSTPAAQ